MKTKKLMKALAGLLDQGKRKKRKHRDELKALLRKLKKKKVELEEKLSRETDEHKRLRLSKELEIIRVQREKGLTALEDLLKS